MKALALVFTLGWAAFWIYWLVAAISTKGRLTPRSRPIGLRLVFVAVVIFLLHTNAFHGHSIHTNSWRAVVGLVLFVAGLSFAIWARTHIGRNWGMPQAKKSDPELVTSGPYRFVRHPIYTGILSAGIGTAVVFGWVWLIAVVIYGTYLIYSATKEERYMTEKFPETYPAYQRSSKMLVPFIF